MKKEKDRGTFTKILAIAGTILAWIPIVFTVFTAVVGSIFERKILFDFLMPAELFPIALAGSLLLLWAAKRSGLRFRMIGCGFVAAAFFLAGTMVIASVTGMASGETEAAGMPFVMTVSTLVLYEIALIGIGIIGILLWKDLFVGRE